jgi:hypothetical protein
MKTCLLCDRRADSKEHYIPAWLGKACEAASIVIVRGKTIGGSVTEAQPIGQIKGAQSRILCRACNSALGKHIEVQVKKMISQYVSPDASIGTLRVDADILVKWMTLRALEASFVLKQPLLSLNIGDQMVRICQSGRDGTDQNIWPWFAPSLEAVIVQEQTLGCAVSQSFYSTERGSVKSTASGFWFFLQMNRLGLLLIHVPSAQRNNASGYGLRLFPPGAVTVNTRGIRTKELPTYDNIKEVYSRLTCLNTETALP